MRLIPPRVKDLGGFTVRRLLPWAQQRMVGPFIFFDHMGPAHFKPGQGIDVRPHPHIGLATVTYLFQGAFHHRDSLGSDQLIEPGAVNWMIAGRGVVHSERSPAALRANGPELHGIQLWVAVPEEREEDAPSFSHHPQATLPAFEVEGVPVRLLLGTLLGHTSPVPTLSPIFYAEARLRAGQTLAVPVAGAEAGVYVVEGEARVNGEVVPAGTMAVATGGADLQLEATGTTRLMLLGGAPLGPRHIEWNFVSSSAERLAEAKRLWAQGPAVDNPRFHPIPGDEMEYIPYP